MPYLDNWLADSGSVIAGQAASRAIAAYNAILDNPTSVAFRNVNGITIAAQTVRIEPDNTARPLDSEAGMSNIRTVTIFGVRGHPTIADTIIESGYIFWLQNDEYTCLDPIISAYDVQCTAQHYG